MKREMSQCKMRQKTTTENIRNIYQKIKNKIETQEKFLAKKFIKFFVVFLFCILR